MLVKQNHPSLGGTRVEVHCLGLGLNDEETPLGSVQIQISGNTPQSNFL